ncbi:MAG: hypothetical protein JG776_1529 [Caloramator sp.]|jgi:uncharacterized membrane protein HdeD (DUF308 family)|uniref:hypothetical protein n=1 Tax=Caloramator sp. TaxID=1871330 RepID=UPI0003F99B04|nr:hypothetical protein [Caloramator sp.]MBZ4663814.1 hypothetical protein [Caloramator sp.]
MSTIKKIKKLWCDRYYIGLLLIFFGLGLILAIIAPWWVWVLVVGVCIIIYGINKIC